jgi:eukaryotic-like serine/threonine-protein kinase
MGVGWSMTQTRYSAKYITFILIFVLVVPIISSTAYAAQDSPKVLFDETGTYSSWFKIFNIENFGTSSFATLLEENGYTVSRITDKPITSDKLKGYDILILMAPYRNFTDEEVNTIKQFVNNGGGLFLVGSNWGDVDGGPEFSYNKIAQSFGVAFANNEIVTDTQNYFLFTNYVKINNITPSPITNQINEFYYVMGTYIKNPGNSTVLAYTPANSFADQGFTTPQGSTSSNNQKDSNEKSGPFPVLSTMNYGKGKIVFMGSAGTLTNFMVYRDNGWKLGLNSVNWLSNSPIPSNYKSAGLISVNLANLLYLIIAMIIYTIIIFAGLIYKMRKDKKSEGLRTIKTIKNWKFNLIIILNAIFAVLGAILFIPINYLLFDITISPLYDPYFGYILLITGVLYIFFMGIILFNTITSQKLLIRYSYFNIALLLLFAGITIILGELFAFPIMIAFTIGSLILIIPLAINLWFHRSYGQYLIIEGKEFDRLEKLSANALLYEFRTIYTDLDYLGEGGFGRVFKAINKKGQKVAIKIPKTFDKRAERTFITEVSNWSHLDHPNIVKLYDFKILPIPYIETEYCEDQLKKEMKPLKEAVNIIYEVAKGLKYAHSKHIIHGDVKFSNVLIKDGVYKISDWGLSKLKTDESLSLSGATPSYAAPEQISHDFGKADERTDIYQLGTVFYALLTGRLPFKGEIFQIYSSTLTKMPTPPNEINANAEPVNDIIMKCLSKNKDDRYSTMGELIEELEDFIANETVLFDKKPEE